MPQATVERPSAAEVKLTVTLAPSDYRPGVQKELKELSKKANIRGFRKGKVPTSYLKKLYGRGAVATAIGNAVDKAIKERIEAEELNIFGTLTPVEEPDMERISPDVDTELTFVYEGGLLPKVESLDTSGLANVNRYSVELSDEEALERLDNARKRFVSYDERDVIETEEDFATLVVADEALDHKFINDTRSEAEPQAGVSEAEQAGGAATTTEGDAAAAKTEGNAAAANTDDDATGDAGTDVANDGDDVEYAEVEVEDADNADADGIDDDTDETDPRQRYFLRPADLVDEQRYKLIDRAKGTELILALADFKEDVRERFDKVIGEADTTTFTIAKVDREQMPGADDVEAYRKIFGEGTEVTDEASALAEFRRRFAANSQENLDEFALEQVIDRLTADNPVELPRRAMVRRLFEAQRDQREQAAKDAADDGEDEDEADDEHQLTEADIHGLGRRLQWMAFRQRLLEEHKVELEAADIDAGIEVAYRTQIGGMGIDPEQFRDRFFPMFKKNLLENREQVMEMTDNLLNLKLIRKLEEDSVLGERRSVGEGEFSRVVEAYNGAVKGELERMRGERLEEV